MQKPNFYLLIPLFVLVSASFSYGQCTYSISPSTHHNWVDVSAQYRTNETALGFDSTIIRFSDKLQVASEPLNATQDLVTRSYVRFDLYADGRNNCGWSRAVLNLMFTGNSLDSHNIDSGANDFIISRIIEDWGPDTLRWRNPPLNAQYRMPRTTTVGSVYVKGSTVGDEDFEANLNDIFTFWRARPDSNFGFEIRLANESGKRSVTFASAQFPNPTVQPFISARINACNWNLAEAGADAAICNGDGITLSGDHAEFFEWSGGPLSNRYIANPVATPTTTTMYYLQTTVGSCVTTDSVLITVHDYPTLSLNSAEEICEGESIDLVATGNGLNFSWSPNEEIVGINSSTATVTPTETRVYKVSSDNGNFCTSEAQVTVTVRPLTATEAGENTLICEGGEVQLLAKGASTYTWIRNTTGLSKTSGGDPKASPASTTMYFVEGSNGFCPTVDSVLVTVVPSFTIDIGKDDSICLGDTAFVSGPTGFTYYRWSPTTEVKDPFTANTFALELKATTEFELYVEDANGCSSTDKKNIVVNNPPTVEIGKDTFVCFGSDILVVPETITGTSPYRYLWSDENGDTTDIGILNSAKSRDIQVSGYKDTVFLYKFRVTDKFGCVSEDDITISMLPVLDITTFGDTTICKGASTEIGVEGGKYYTWTGPNIASLPTRKTIKVNPEIATTYTVEAGNGEACSEGVLGYVTVDVIEPPRAYIHTIESEVEVDTLLVCKGRYANLEASGADLYVWNIDSLGPNLDYRLVTPTALLSVYGILEGDFETPDCAGPIDTILLMLNPDDSCLSKIFAPSAFTPNGDGDNDSFTVKTLLIRNYSIKIFNRWGQEMFSSVDPKDSWTGYYGNERVPEGVYYYVIDAFGEDEESRSTNGTITVLY